MATVGVTQPGMAVRLLRAKLNRDLALAKSEADKLQHAERPEAEDMGALMAWEFNHSPALPITKLIEDSQQWDSLSSLADSVPEVVLRELWPWFQIALASLREIEDPADNPMQFAVSRYIDFRFEDEDRLGRSEPSLLGGMRIAAENLAANNPDEFLIWLDTHSSENAVPAQRLFAHVLASQPERYARRALDFITSDARRFVLGSSGDSFSTTKRLVQSVAPFWSDNDLKKFVDAVLSYKPNPPSKMTDAKSRQYFKRYIRRIRLGLLRALPLESLASPVRRLITEETRVFPEEQGGPTILGPAYIGSPMEAEAMGRASDEDIVKAFNELPDSTGWDHPKKWMAGGSIQLSRAFADFAKSDPERAVRLIGKFTPGIGERAAGYALDAMAESADGALITNLVVDLASREFDSEEFRVSAARAIERLVQRNAAVSDSVVELLEQWLRRPNRPHDGGGDKEGGAETNEVHNPDDIPAVDVDSSDEPPRTILWDTFVGSILPHGNYPVLETLARILLARRDPDRLIKVLRDHLSRPENPMVWQAFLHYLVYLQPSNDQALSELLSDLFKTYPQVSRSQEAAMLLAQIHWRAPEFVRATLEDWKGIPNENLQQAYGELVTLIAVVRPNLHWAKERLEHLIKSPESRRAHIGAAFSAIHLWRELALRELSTEILIRIIPYADRALWAAIFDLFRLIDELTPEPNTIRLLEKISNHVSAAGPLSATFIVDRLETLLPHHALLVARIAESLVANWRSELGDARRGTALAAPKLVDLAITLHRLGPSTRDIGTSLFEDLLLIDAYSARQTLVQIDNRFAAYRYPSLPRLPRRRRSQVNRRGTT